MYLLVSRRRLLSVTRCRNNNEGLRSLKILELKDLRSFVPHMNWTGLELNFSFLRYVHWVRPVVDRVRWEGTGRDRHNSSLFQYERQRSVLLTPHPPSCFLQSRDTTNCLGDRKSKETTKGSMSLLWVSLLTILETSSFLIFFLLLDCLDRVFTLLEKYTREITRESKLR